MSRTRQFGQTRSSRSRSKIPNSPTFSKSSFMIAGTPKNNSQSSKSIKDSIRSSAASQYMCVNCINIDLSKSRQKSKQEEKRANELFVSRQVERSFQKAWQSEKQHQKTEEAHRKINQYNKNLIDRHSKQKQIKEQNKHIQRQRAQQTRLRQQFQAEQSRLREQKKKEYWRNDILNQISLHQKKKQKEEIEAKRKSMPTQPDFTEKFNRIRDSRNEHYRNELIKQMDEHQAQKQQQKLNKNMEFNRVSAFIQQAQKRTKKYQQQMQQRKRQLLEDARRNERKLQIKKQAQQQKARKQRETIEQRDRQLSMKSQIYQKSKKQKMKQYIQEVKEQIADKNFSKQRERNRQRYYDSTLPIYNSEQMKKNCNSCEKSYPKEYLSKVNSKKKQMRKSSYAFS